MVIEKPFCPRCGYDQSGAIAAWDRNEPGSCPLSGMCTECGLEFAWRDVLNPVYSRQLQMFEHAQRRHLASLRLTWWKAARPWAFWRWIRMEHTVVPSRILVFAVVCILVNAMICAVSLFIATRGVELLQHAIFGNGMPMTGWSDRWALFRLVEWDSDLWRDTYGDVPAPWMLVSMLAVLVSPLTFLLLPQTLRRARVRRLHLLRVWVYCLAFLPILFAVPVLLVVMAAAIFVADIGLFGAGYLTAGLGVWIGHHPYAPGLLCVTAWLMVWWVAAARRYLRLPHALGVAAAVTIVSVLVATGLIAAFPGGTRWMVWDL